jgi:hypothetical protein
MVIVRRQTLSSILVLVWFSYWMIPVNLFWHARFVSSSVILCSIRKCATWMALAGPVIVTIRLRVPGANIPFFEICILAPEIFCISTKLVPPGPVVVICLLNGREKRKWRIRYACYLLRWNNDIWPRFSVGIIRNSCFVSVNVCKFWRKKIIIIISKHC